MAQPRDNVGLQRFARRARQRVAVAQTVLTADVQRKHDDLWDHQFDFHEIISVAQIQPTENVLDLGTGYGDLASMAAGVATNGQVYGVDLDIGALEVAVALHRTAPQNLHFVHGDVFAMTDPSTNRMLEFPVKFDVVTTSRLLHNIERDAGRRQIFQALRSFLKPNARLVLDFCSIATRFCIPVARLRHPATEQLLNFQWTDAAIRARVIREFQSMIPNYNLQSVPGQPIRLYLGQGEPPHVFINIATQFPQLFLDNLAILRSTLTDNRVSAGRRADVGRFLRLYDAVTRTNSPLTISQWVAQNIQPVHFANTVDPRVVSGEKWFELLKSIYGSVLMRIQDYRPHGPLMERSAITYPKMYQVIGVFRYQPLPRASNRNSSGSNSGI